MPIESQTPFIDELETMLTDLPSDTLATVKATKGAQLLDSFIRESRFDTVQMTHEAYLAMETRLGKDAFENKSRFLQILLSHYFTFCAKAKPVEAFLTDLQYILANELGYNVECLGYIVSFLVDKIVQGCQQEEFDSIMSQLRSGLPFGIPANYTHSQFSGAAQQIRAERSAQLPVVTSALPRVADRQQEAGVFVPEIVRMRQVPGSAVLYSKLYRVIGINFGPDAYRASVVAKALRARLKTLDLPPFNRSEEARLKAATTSTEIGAIIYDYLASLDSGSRKEGTTKEPFGFPGEEE